MYNGNYKNDEININVSKQDSFCTNEGFSHTHIENRGRMANNFELQQSGHSPYEPLLPPSGPHNR